MAVNWEQVNAKLPFARNKAAFSKRKDMWTAIDVNGNGFLSLAEVTKVTKNTKTFLSHWLLPNVSQGVRDVIAVDELFDAIPAINRSFHHCKAVSKSSNEKGDDYIEFKEFRLFLQTLRQFFEYYQAFDR